MGLRALSPGDHGAVAQFALMASFPPDEQPLADADERGAGVGTSLITDLVARAAAAGCIGLSLTVSETNRAAIHLYDGAGFVARGRTSTGQLVMVWRPGP